VNKVTVAATQFACAVDRKANLDAAEALVRRAAGQGANVILIQELFETPYFCIGHDTRHFDLAMPIADNPAVRRFTALARELGVVLPVSVFERAGNAYYNSVAIVDAGGELLGIYRKAHIPESPGYHEKFYFSPGDTGFRVWQTQFGRLGVGICWDQWFPECARVMALKGAEPQDPSLDSRDHWRRTMQGHAAANIMPVIASNRIGTERGGQWSVTYYGSSFIADHTGALVAEADRISETILTATFDLTAINEYRRAWGVFRDRRPELYGPLLTLDGSVASEP
jgi:N-carbamoylputrescine amidase